MYVSVGYVVGLWIWVGVGVGVWVWVDYTGFGIEKFIHGIIQWIIQGFVHGKGVMGVWVGYVVRE